MTPSARPVRLELVMTTPLTDDDVRDLFSDHLEGSLDEQTKRAVDDALAKNATLRAEHDAFRETLSLLRALPREGAPDGLVGKVRDRLAAERREAAGRVVDPSEADSPATRRAQASWVSPARVVGGLAAVAAAVAVLVIASPGADGPKDMLGASLFDAAVSVSWQAPGVPADVVVVAAAAAGMGRDGEAFVGDQRAAARFFVELKGRAAALGSDVSGAVPEHVDRVVVTIAR